jgi:hypothetical protein
MQATMRMVSRFPSFRDSLARISYSERINSSGTVCLSADHAVTIGHFIQHLKINRRRLSSILFEAGVLRFNCRVLLSLSRFAK